MTHAYRQLIHVESKPWAACGDVAMPTTFTWRGERYRVLHANAPWHLMTRWWEDVPETWQGGKGQTDRWYWRVVARGEGHSYEIVCELYRDATQNVWVMDRIYDWLNM